ncbi:hypothetical protein [Carboxylicivirga sp. N1Y90]|uniref:hypothetical protein n=1 Tax=Carboxylicivirga fragile TaxID=3417571 RepID=UPI003D34FE7F|nr:hypothetical protein [Marinilabiliaceae bacterium N1Y90]
MDNWYKFYLNDLGLGIDEHKSELNSFDFSSVLLKTHSSSIYGVIGDDMQRIKIKWISINKDPFNPDTYYAYGKTNVKGNVCEFTGVLKIRTIRLFPKEEYDMPSSSKVNPEKIGVLFCDYNLVENKRQLHTGVFKGVSASEFYIHKGKLFYNDLRASADDMSNNLFVGEWISNSTKKSKICFWGDYRVPNVSGFDCGAAVFSPCSKFDNKGWDDIDEAYNLNDQEALKRELEEWW